MDPRLAAEWAEGMDYLRDRLNTVKTQRDRERARRRALEGASGPEGGETDPVPLRIFLGTIAAAVALATLAAWLI